MRMISFTLSEASLKTHPKLSLLFHKNPHQTEKIMNQYKFHSMKSVWKNGELGDKSQGFHIIKFRGGKNCQGFHKSFIYYLVFILMNKESRKEVPQD